MLIFLLITEVQAALDWQMGNHKIIYQPQTKTYEWFQAGESKRSYPRHRVERLIADLSLEAAIEAPEVFESLKTHAQLEFLTSPTPEELLNHAFQMQEAAMRIVHLPDVQPCDFQKHFDPSLYTLEVSNDMAAELERELIGAHLERQGFLSLGKLTGVSIELITNNDNFLHGLSQNTGLTEHRRGIEGDDRGKTFGINGEVKLEFESGELSIRSTHQGYGRLAPQPSTFVINGQEYTTYHRQNANGEHYQEFMNIEGLEVEIKKVLPGSDVYIKLDGKQEIFDQKGLAQKLQQKWHDMHKDSGIIQYENLDHMDKTKRYEIGASVGKDFLLYQNSRHQIRSELSTGLGYSSDSDFHNLRVGADLRYQYHRKEEGDQRYPIFEARVYTGAKRYADAQTDTSIGLELTQRFQVTKNGFIYLKGGIAKEDERYAREFGREEIQHRGKLDFQHKLGIGLELRF